MRALVRAKDRGRSQLEWLDSHHTFSFGDYHDPRRMGFGALRVVNEDRVRPRSGFSTHPHRDMEIITYVLEGALGHKDSMGNGSVIHPGELQRMTAGTGVTHSEWNDSADTPVHFLQLWIVPEARGLAPSYQQQALDLGKAEQRLQLVASPDARAGALALHQDAEVWVGCPPAGVAQTHALAPGRRAWVQVMGGEIRVAGEELGPGDGLGLPAAGELELLARSNAHLLLFDLA